jgi:hypothetical protein
MRKGKIVGRVQFYANDRAGTRRIFSFRVFSQESAINALTRMNIRAGWYKPDEDRRFSVKIENPHYVGGSPTAFNNTADFFQKLKEFIILD